ncbi:MAG: acyltransferase [Lachnospiraceae bacterium]|nr:acyltransferase [Lachnospiraceae bacterium]
MTKENKSEFYHFCKVLLTILVVVGHVAHLCCEGYAESNDMGQWFLHRITQLIYLFHMPMFMAVSGMVYGYITDKGGYADLFKFVKNKILRLLIPYLFWGIFFVSPIVYSLNMTELSLGDYIIKGIVRMRDPKYLWFLICLFEIFVFMDITRRICDQIGRVKWLSIVLLILLVVMSFIGKYFDIPLGLGRAMYQCVFFYMGILFDRIAGRSTKVITTFFILLGSSVILGGAFIKQMQYTTYSSNFFGAVSGGIIFLIVVNFIFNRSIIQNWIKTDIYKSIVSSGMGIFIFHLPINWIAISRLKNIGMNRIFLAIFMIIFSYGISWLITVLLKRTPIKKML